eukprot:10203581-Karenia_brevis.AAC.1
MERKNPPPVPAGLEGCDAATRIKWKSNGYAMPPYQFKRDHGVIDNGEERPLNALEKEKLHGFKPGHTRGYPEKARMSFLGNTFH